MNNDRLEAIARRADTELQYLTRAQKILEEHHGKLPGLIVKISFDKDESCPVFQAAFHAAILDRMPDLVAAAVAKLQAQASASHQELVDAVNARSAELFDAKTRRVA